MSGATAYHPLKGVNVHFTSRDEACVWNSTFQKAFGEKREVALRLGERITENASCTLKPGHIKKLFQKKISFDDLKESVFSLNMKQSGVDMRIGLGIASLVYEGIVDQAILVSGDVDFVPAAKVARRHGIDFIVDNRGEHIRDDLKIHADRIVATIERMSKSQPQRACRWERYGVRELADGVPAHAN